MLAPAIEAGEIDVVVDPRRRAPAGRHATCSPTSSTPRPGWGGAIPADDQGQLASLDGGDPPARPGGGRADPAGVRRAAAARGLPARGRRDGFIGTDTASCIERYTEEPVHCVDGRRRQHQDHLPRRPVPGRAAARQGTLGPVRRPRAGRPSRAGCTCPASAAREVTDERRAGGPALRDLRPGHRARAALLGPVAGVGALHACAAPTSTSPPATCCRRTSPTSSSGWSASRARMVRRVARDPVGYRRGSCRGRSPGSRRSSSRSYGRSSAH